jgi:hypothetical protein
MRRREPNKLIKFLKDWNELAGLPLALILFMISPSILRLVDPTAATFDAGVLQVIILGVIAFLVASALSWLMVKLTFPQLYRYLDEVFELEIIKASCDKHSFIAFSVYAFYLLCLLFAMAVFV